ncbi:MAG: sigma-70 family RNA polymerase sigma factor [Acidobacteria bacterium]|nr:sigma-70 family RNA polymerase sigma factor [Acidobacteriota bacterium]
MTPAVPPSTPSNTASNVTQLLVDWRNGDQAAFEQLMPVVYDELRRIAKRYMSREASHHTLQTTALVNEAYLRLVNQQDVEWQNRAHFFAISAQIMRHLLVDHARARNYAKRGGGAIQVSLNEEIASVADETVDLLALDEALTRLAAVDARKSRIVELRFFGGLSVEETAEVLNVSAITIKREWLKAKAWLYRELSQEQPDDPGALEAD